MERKKQRLSSSCSQMVLGPPGSGKTTYTRRAVDVLSQTRKTCVVNLDPANESGWKGANVIDIRQLITCEDAAKFLHLGPNASFMFCLEFLDTDKGREWLVTQLSSKEQGTYFIFDLPGQIELVTHHTAIRNVIHYLCREEGLRMVAVHLMDAQFATDGQKFVSVAMLALSSMMRLELPHVNVLSKMDLLDEESLDFPLYFYAESPSFSMLASRIQAPEKHRRLLASMCQLLDDYNQVAFQLLSTSADDTSVMNLLETCDKAIGYVSLTSPKKM